MSRPVKILIVDDEKLFRLNLRAMLEDLGYLAAEAADGREALEVFDSERPDLVLADLTMPVMDGLSMVSTLREKSPETPVVVISGTGTVRDAVASLRLGAWDYVLKQITTQEDLDISIKRALEKARLLRENRLYKEHLEELVQERTNELLESRNFLNTLLDAIPIPVYYKDGTGRYLGCNRAYETFLGLKRDQLAGKTVFDISSLELAKIGHAKDKELFEKGGVQQYERKVRNSEGLLRDVIFNKAVFTGDDGGAGGLVGTLLDITERRKAEEERKLLEAQLHQAQKMEAIGQLAGGIAHDFNNILTAIIGYAEIIQTRMEKDGKLRHFAEQILASADRAAELTNGLLAFSRKQNLHLKPIELCGVIRDLRKMLRRLLPEDIDFRTTVAEEELVVMADKGRIEQVIMNLVTNARDAVTKGGVIVIKVFPEVMTGSFAHAHGFGDPGYYACISVSDTGRGMDEETMKMIFDPFFTTKETGKGTGLGMAIVFGIVKQHNGCITVSSETGKGTTFRIYLPLAKEGIPDANGARVEEQPPPGGTETVLLVEDESTIRELHRMILEEAGYRVIEAADGEKALEKFMGDKTESDIIVTDVIMPKIDGKRLCDEIRKFRPDMKVLFVSGYTKDIFVERGILGDGLRYLSKPYKASELLKSVRDALDGH